MTNEVVEMKMTGNQLNFTEKSPICGGCAHTTVFCLSLLFLLKPSLTFTMNLNETMALNTIRDYSLLGYFWDEHTWLRLLHS